MKTISLKNLTTLLQGLLDGSIELQAVINERNGVQSVVKIVETPQKRTRKPMSKSKKAASASVKQHAEEDRLPSSREIFLFLDGKINGEKLTDIAKHFKVRRSLLKPLLTKLTKQKDLLEKYGVYYLHRRIRNPQRKAPAKPAPLEPAQVLSTISQNPALTMSELAKVMGEPSYHRLIKVINKLKNDNKLRLENNRYFAA